MRELLSNTKDINMSFLCNGSNHVTGIENEVSMTNRFNQDLTKTIFPDITVPTVTEMRGGTKSKADAVIIDLSKIQLTDEDEGKIIKKLSFKKKNKTNTGTFDWVNSTSFLTQARNDKLSSVDPIVALISEATIAKNSGKVTDEDVESFRMKTRQATDTTLNSFSSDDIKMLIKKLMIDSNKDIEVLVTVINTQDIYYFPFSAHPIIKMVNDSTVKFFFHKKSKKAHCDSRTVMAEFTDELGLTKVVDTGVRIRLHLNNGVQALLGVSKTNSTSSFCLKFQQDNFKEIIKIAKKYK
jgi:hypothetical protein